jgi:hypothetical protein
MKQIKQYNNEGLEEFSSLRKTNLTIKQFNNKTID